MAATIATAIGRDQRGSTNVEKECTRLGAQQAEGRAATFKTFTTCKVNADGSGFVKVERQIGGKRQHIGTITFDKETAFAIAEFYAGVDTKPCRRDGYSEADQSDEREPFDASTTGGQF